MGTWGVGPFDNDTAADFAIALDKAEMGEREVLIRSVLLRTADATGYLSEAQQAASALIAAQYTGGDPVELGHEPEKPMPVFEEDIRSLAVEALDHLSCSLSRGTYQRALGRPRPCSQPRRAAGMGLSQSVR